MGLVGAAAHQSFTQSGVGQVVILVVAGFLGSMFWKVASAFGDRFGKRLDQPGDTAGDVDSFSKFLFDQPGNPRTKTPGSVGWTTVVNAELEDHRNELAEVKNLVANEVVPKLDSVVASLNGKSE